MNMAKRACIYCLRNEDLVTLNREHIIPQNIKGNLFLDDCVCTKCNSWIGANVDTEALKLPKTLEALDKFNIHHDKDIIFRQSYDIKGKSTKSDLSLKGLMKNGEVYFPPQEVENGSLVAPDGEIDKILRKMSTRDKRLINAGLDKPYIFRELKKFKHTYDQAKPGEKIEWPNIGRAVKRRSEKIEIKIKPKTELKMEKLIAKIAFEFLFFVGGIGFFKQFDVDIGAQLIYTISGNNPPRDVLIYRAKPEIIDLIPVHLIRFETSNTSSMFRISFFGSIEYHCILPPSMNILFKGIVAAKGFEDLVGIHFQQHIDKPIKVFWALMNNGKRERLW